MMPHQGGKSKALLLIRKAILSSPANPDIHYHLAKALGVNDDKTQEKMKSVVC